MSKILLIPCVKYFLELKSLTTIQFPSITFQSGVN